MSKVFLSGSRKISRLSDEVRARLKNMISNNLEILIGDANGADKAMQTFLFHVAYPKVTVFCSGGYCRNNIGRWASQLIDVEPNIKGREFYEKKDKAMAALADFGFVLWDGQSVGSIANAFELVRQGKKVVIYFAPWREFVTIASLDDLGTLLNRCDPDIQTDIRRKVELEDFRQPHQASIDFAR
ncbi:MAG: hypothetical protein J0G99_01085 [Alphaproteobacteria bacterium]|nr:hypothetical protein [Alphaproteobacteria bacterium]